MLEILKAIVQGIVQGITEWLPISSTGHMILVNQFMPFANQAFFNLFDVLVQLGSIMAVVVLYFNRLNPFSGKKTPVQKKNTWTLWGKILIASVPAAAVGMLISDLRDKFSTPLVISIALIVYGILFIWMENRKWKPRINSFKELDYKTVIFIGIFQMLALIPGTSRSGSTILGAVLIGCARPLAAEFSFFMAIPVMLGASLWELKDYVIHPSLALSGTEIAALIIGMIVAFIVSLFVIRFLMQYIKKHDFKVFGFYRIVLGILVLILMLTHVIGTVAA